MVYEVVNDMQRDDSCAKSSGNKACPSHSWNSKGTELESEILLYKSSNN